MTTQTVSESKIHEFAGKVLNDYSAAASAPLVIIGDRLSLFRALADMGSQTSEELARATGTSERYVREWLSAMAASEYVEYDAVLQKFTITPEQAAVFADPDSPVLMTGGYYSLSSMFADEPLVSEAFKTGKGIEWGEHNGCLFCGVEKFFRPFYKANLIQSWLPALPGVIEKLEAGCRVADVGCGHGVSTMIMAEAFPNSTFVGFDIHEASIEHANQQAREANLKNVRFEVATAKNYPGTWDFVAFFDCLHDMGDPAGAAAHVYESLAEGGAWMIVEPMAGDNLEDNLNPVGRAYYSFSTTICTPTALSQEVGTALGAQAGRAKLTEVIRAGGFTDIQVAAETPFNMVLDARK